jgi:hypothetical protein
MIAAVEEIARTLKAKRNRAGFIARCPAHEDRTPSLSISDGADGKVLVHCHAGCSQSAVLDALHALGIDFGSSRVAGGVSPRTFRSARDDNPNATERLELARHLWGKSQPASDTAAEVYLHFRGFHGPIPGTIRYLPSQPKHVHALIAAFGIPQEPEPGRLEIAADLVRGVMLIALKSGGRGKADVDVAKRMIGPSNGWPIVLAPPSDHGGLAIAEGIEDALVLHEETGLGAWAAGSAGRLPLTAQHVPNYVESVSISEDDNEAGRAGTRGLAEALIEKGIEVLILPSMKGRA